MVTRFSREREKILNKVGLETDTANVTKSSKQPNMAENRRYPT